MDCGTIYTNSDNRGLITRSFVDSSNFLYLLFYDLSNAGAFYSYTKINLTDWTPLYLNVMPNATLLTYNFVVDESPLGFLSEDETKLFLIVRITTGVGIIEVATADGSISRFHELAFTTTDNK